MLSDAAVVQCAALNLPILSVLLHVWGIVVKFATADRIAEARSRAMRVGRRDIMKSVYSTLFLDD